MASVMLDRMRGADSEAKPSYRLVNAIKVHREPIGGNPTTLFVRWLARTQLEPEIPISKRPDVVQQLHGAPQV
jgi:hypothetical protein